MDQALDKLYWEGENNSDDEESEFFKPAKVIVDLSPLYVEEKEINQPSIDRNELLTQLRQLDQSLQELEDAKHVKLYSAIGSCFTAHRKLD